VTFLAKRCEEDSERSEHWILHIADVLAVIPGSSIVLIEFNFKSIIDYRMLQVQGEYLPNHLKRSAEFKKVNCHYYFSDSSYASFMKGQMQVHTRTSMVC